MKRLQIERFCGEPQIRINDPLQCLSASQYQYLLRQLEALGEECPDYSSLELTFSLDEYFQLNAHFCIKTLRFQLDESCSSSSVTEAWDYLSSKAKKKLSEWKSQRFILAGANPQAESPLAS